MAPTLGYWNIRGLCNPIRFILAYLGVEYEEKLYPASATGKSWFAEKFTLGLEFPNLPYWIEGDLKLTESKAILKYLAREKDQSGSLIPTSNELIRRADVIENVAGELMYTLLIMYCWRMTDECEKKRLLDQYADKLKQLSEFMGQKKWALGNEISYVDFPLYEALYLHSQFNKECIKPYVNLQDYMNRFEQIPTIAEYMASPKYLKEPCNSRFALHPF